MRQFMLAGTAFCLLGAFFSLGGIVVAPMAFDVPGSDKLFVPWAMAIGLLSLPASCVAGPLIAWASYFAGWERVARGAMFLPLIWLVLYPVAAVIIGGYCGWTVACDGAPSST